jgi:hypothetical protein
MKCDHKLSESLWILILRCCTHKMVGPFSDWILQDYREQNIHLNTIGHVPCKINNQMLFKDWKAVFAIYCSWTQPILTDTHAFPVLETEFSKQFCKICFISIFKVRNLRFNNMPRLEIRELMETVIHVSKNDKSLSLILKRANWFIQK